MIDKETADKKVKEGWIKAWFMFEAIAINENIVKEALEDLIKKLENDKRTEICKKQFLDAKKLQKPLEAIKEGFSQVCEIELICKNFDNLVRIVLEYGPSAAEILEPKKIGLNIADAQGILNSIAEMMHRFAQAGVGGIIIARGE